MQCGISCCDSESLQDLSKQSFRLELADPQKVGLYTTIQSRSICVVQISFLRSEDLPVLRSTCVNMVLGTDMKKHFDIMSRFQVPLAGMTPPCPTAP